MNKVFQSTDPDRGDSDVTLLEKLAQKLGAVLRWGETSNSALAKILVQVGSLLSQTTSLAAQVAGLEDTVNALPVPPKVYRALLTQGGTDAPVATVLENTLGVIPVWSRSDVGEFYAGALGAFPVGKTFCIGDVGYENFLLFHDNADTVSYIAENAGTSGDGVLTHASVQILVYP